MRKKIIKLFIYFGLVHLIFFLIHLLYDFNGMKVLRIGKEALNDISFNDFHYRIADAKLKEGSKDDFLLHYKDNDYPKEICLINCADMPDSNFRSEFVSLVHKIQNYAPKAIGIDLTFNKNLPHSKEIQVLAEAYDNMVWAKQFSELDKDNIDFGGKNMGSIKLITDTKTIRKYSANNNSFAYKLAQKAYPSMKFKEFSNSEFFIHYNSIGNGMIRYDDVTNPNIELNYHYIPANDLLDTNKVDMNMAMAIDAEINNKVVIIGYLGQENRRKFDVEDKWCTPTDVKNIVQRDPLMYGAVIHANAFYNIVHEESRYSEWTGWVFILISNVLLLLFLAFLIFFHLPKIINIMLVTFLVLPMLYFTVKFMEYGIYISVGATILHVIVIEEMVEIIDPIYKRISQRVQHLIEKKK